MSLLRKPGWSITSLRNDVTKSTKLIMKTWAVMGGGGEGLVAMEVGLAEGSLFGKVELYKPTAHNGMYKCLEISLGLD